VIETIVGLIVLGLDIWAIVNILKSGERGGIKLLWILLILLLPLLGLLLWLFIGPKAPAPP
jgi:hypothetical protein